jgi:hypothetical protein
VRLQPGEDPDGPAQRALTEGHIRLGGQREGVLRRHTRREDGTFRDTVVFSVLADEWPTVRAGLKARLS